MNNKIIIKSITLFCFFSLMSAFIAFKIGKFDSIIYSHSKSLFSSSNGGVAEIEEKIKLVEIIEQSLNKFYFENSKQYNKIYSDLNNIRFSKDSLNRINIIENYFEKDLALKKSELNRIIFLNIINDLVNTPFYELISKYKLDLIKFKYDKRIKYPISYISSIYEIDRYLYLIKKIQAQEKMMAMSSKVIISIDKLKIKEYERFLEIKDAKQENQWIEYFKSRLDDSCKQIFVNSNLPYYLTSYTISDLEQKLIERKKILLEKQEIPLKKLMMSSSKSLPLIDLTKDIKVTKIDSSILKPDSIHSQDFKK